jgi:HSP20 family protein
MAGLVPFNRKGSLLNRDFGNMIDDFFSSSWPYERSLSRDTFKLDVQDKGKEYLIEAEIPGVKKEEINLELNEGRLTISITREEKIDEEKNNYVHKERRHSSMSRSIYLADAMQEGVKAGLKDGVLTVIVPKSEKPETSHKINID